MYTRRLASSLPLQSYQPSFDFASRLLLAVSESFFGIQTKQDALHPFMNRIKRVPAVMSIFLIFGKDAPEQPMQVFSKRTDKARAVIRKHGGEIRSMYAAQREVDVVFAVDFPGLKEADEASVELNQTTGMSFTTTPVMDAD